MVPEFHKYHLDDDPELTSCSLVVERQAENLVTDYASEVLSQDKLANFYGGNSPLKYHYVRDLTNGGKFATRDVELEPL